MWCGGSRVVFVFHHLRCSSLLVFLAAVWIHRHMNRQWMCRCFFVRGGWLHQPRPRRTWKGRKMVHVLHHKELIGTRWTERVVSRSNILSKKDHVKLSKAYLTSLHRDNPDHTAQSCCLLNPLPCGYADEGGKARALIGQAVGSSVSSSKWRHVRPVRLQLGPDCFPEAPEASPCLSAHRSGRRVPPPRCPDLSWHETGLFSYWGSRRHGMWHAGRRVCTQTRTT